MSMLLRLPLSDRRAMSGFADSDIPRSSHENLRRVRRGRPPWLNEHRELSLKSRKAIDPSRAKGKGTPEIRRVAPTLRVEVPTPKREPAPRMGLKSWKSTLRSVPGGGQTAGQERSHAPHDAWQHLRATGAVSPLPPTGRRAAERRKSRILDGLRPGWEERGDWCRGREGG